MTSGRRVIAYSILRVVLFAIPFAILMLLGVFWWISAPLAAVIAACLSYLFLRPQRDGVATAVYGWRNGDHHDDDNDIENAALDRRESGTTEL